ncbi:hypothetical protein EON63_01330 [archaeon]|nr:MAG: hypothetical protein EON63_01330 [archaeon]
MSNEYWYGPYSRANLKTDPLRKEVLKPCGLFLVNGKPTLRSYKNALVGDVDMGDIHTSVYTTPPSPTDTHTHTNTLTHTSTHSQSHTTSPSKARIRAPRECDLNAARYYSRLITPIPEVVSAYQHTIRQSQIRTYKHIYHENVYTQQPADVSVHKHQVVGSQPYIRTIDTQSVFVSKQAKRILLPATHHLQSLQRSCGEKTAK